MCAFHQQPMTSEEGKENSDYPISPFPSVSSFREWIVGSCRKVPWVRKDTIGFLGCLCFLEHRCLLSAFEANSGQMENVGSQGCWLPCLLSRRHDTSCIRFESCWISATLGTPKFENAAAISGRHTLHVCSHIRVPLSHRTSLIKYRFKDKFIKKFKTTTERHQTKCEVLLCTGCMPMEPLWWSIA